MDIIKTFLKLLVCLFICAITIFYFLIFISACSAVGSPIFILFVLFANGIALLLFFFKKPDAAQCLKICLILFIAVFRLILIIAMIFSFYFLPCQQLVSFWLGFILLLFLLSAINSVALFLFMISFGWLAGEDWRD